MNSIVFNSIPDNWQIKKLGDVGETLIGLTYSPNDVSENGILVLRSSNIYLNKLKYDDNVYVTKDVREKIINRENDILICVRNGSRRLIGKCALIKGRAVGETFGAFMSVFRSEKNTYLYHVFQSDFIKTQINQHIGATINQITSSNLNSFEFPLPPLPQQKKITKILFTVDTVIEETETAIAKYQAIKQGLMHDLFTRGIDVNTGKLRLTPQDKPELYKASALGLIPKGWEVKRVDEIGEVISGGTPSSSINEFWNGEVIWITPSDLSKLKISKIDNSQRKITKLGLNSSSALLIPKNSIVISSRAPIGYCAIVTEEFTTNQGCKSLGLYNENNPLFFYFNFKQHINRIKIKGEGTTFAEISKKEFEKVQFSSCNPTEQNIIAEKLESVDQKIQTEHQALSKYQQLKAGLLQDLLTGKVEVSVD